MSRVVSNHKILDKIKDKDLIEQMDKEHQEELKKIDYAIDLNTNKVKQNNQYTFYITDSINKDILSYDDALNKDLQNMYLNNMDTFNKFLNPFIDLDNYKVIVKDVDKQDKDKLNDPKILDKYSSKIKDIDTLDKAIKGFNEFYDSLYLNGFNLRVKDLLNDSIKKEYVKQLASAYTQVYVSDLIKIKDNKSDYKEFIDNNKLDSVKDNIKKFIEDTNKELETQAKELSDAIYTSNLKRFNTEIDTTINNNKQYYNKVHKLYQEIDNKIIDIVNQFKLKCIEYNKNTNYEISKFKASNDVISKIDPIAKNIFNGKKYNIGKLFTTKNNYNDKSYGVIFNTKNADLTNIDIIQELQQKGIKINHFDKKVIDDIDLLLDENIGNVSNNDNLIALTPKMIAKKVYNVKQPTKKQVEEIINCIEHLNNIYLFMIKDNTDPKNIDAFIKLDEKGLKYLQDKEGNALNISEMLDEHIILNAERGYSYKYNASVYFFKNKSVFYKINQEINNDVGKQLLLSLKDKSDVIFNDYNKNVNKEVVGIRGILFEKVNQLKHSVETNTKQNNEILLSSIYDEYDITTPKQKKNTRDIIQNILNYWIDINYINKYQFLDKDSIEIQPNSKKPIYKISIDA